MRTLTVSLPGRSYDILIGSGLLHQAGQHLRPVLPRAKKLFVVTDSNVAPIYLSALIPGLERAGFETACREIPAGEASKSAAMLSALWEDMMDFGLTRSDAVVALGGGVVGDLAGFAAATILRGVDFVQIPTTLLAQVDSSVGGKVAVDLQHGKNLAGAFWQPKAVLMDPDTLDTLDDLTFADGMAEVIKYGCILDKSFFDFLALRPGRGEIMEEIEHVLYTCCDLKRMVVEEDERDTGRRMLLNFGHPGGHAFEKMGNSERTRPGPTARRWPPAGAWPPSWASAWAWAARRTTFRPSPSCSRPSTCPSTSPAPTPTGPSWRRPSAWTRRGPGTASASSSWRRWAGPRP